MVTHENKMIAAAYLRKSTDEGAKDADAKSVYRQHQGARAYAERSGWTLDEDHVYTDDGISGAEFGKKRPGLQRLLAALSPRPPFQVLIISEQSRLGCDTIRTLATIQRIQDAGVSLYSYLDGREISIESDTDEIQEFIRSWSSSQERRKAIQRTRDAMHAKARNGYVAGGKVLGYTNVRDGSNVRRVVNDEETKIVERIFTLCADGKGLLRIAKTLNEEGVANPTGQFRRSAGETRSKPKVAAHWAPTGVREVLNRRLYLGEVIYGQTRWERRGGTKRKVQVPESQWIRRAAPELRIISDELWRAAHARLDASRAVYLQRNNGKPGGKPGAGLESKYLLSGFLRCEVCGGNMIVNKRTGPRGKPQLAYVCATHRARPGACSVRHGLLAEDIHVRVVETLAREVFTPERLRQAITDLAQRRSEGDRIDARRRELSVERERIARELKQLVDAVAGGAGDVGALVDAMRSREQTRATLDVQLADLAARAADAQKFDAEGREADLRAVLEDWHAMLDHDTSLGRRALRDVLLSPIFVEREPDGTWSFRLMGSFNGVIKRVYGIQVADADIEAMNVALEAEMAANGHASAYIAYTGDRELLQLGSAAPGDQVDHRVQRDTCPRGDSNTRHAV